jgi:RNA polymerase sigma-70 factor (ECF subfamily)
MSQPDQSDEWLMGQVSLGKRDHLTGLVRRYAGPLLTFIERMTGDRHRSEELMQEVFLRVWLKRKTYKASNRFRSWLFAIAANHCRTAFRRSKPKAESLPERGGQVPVAAGPSPAEAAVSAETANLVAAAVAQLPPQQRMVVVLRTFSGLSFAEIGQAIGRSEVTARSHMHHALCGMRRYLEPRMQQ